MVTETQKTSETFCTSHPEILSQDRFFRYQVFQGLGDVGSEEHKAIPAIVDCTQTYLDLDHTQRIVASLLKTLERLAAEPGTE